MDITKYLKEIDQQDTEYERNKGSLRAVLDYNPELDLEAGMKEDEEEEETIKCTKEDMKMAICMTPIMVGVLLLTGWWISWYVVAGLEVFGEDDQS